ncbi:hydroxyethylthiazole kinase ThiM [Methanobrevibacter ruminantium M1]|uniref:Hydroxyethylthiazole kinase n=1 Tax=Methanobrevibacter ruminantium (strain ATCC 35063 / DSM 1093 / JCM 13430 / OCM 146 / M1) TaxID=634498 RepID=D3DZJ1_METRM|nr:hydroxyethylthiazole kinase [Methanobrevibacter ruminantium]ADC47669.1 hydroxyethylthiazole kinase ThiM [Methanobrevibacter ruminantium M1]
MTNEIIKENTEKIEEILNGIEEAMENVKAKSPLTHCITNFVTINDCANAALAIGGSPIMTNDSQEVAEIGNIASAIVINIGQVSQLQINSIKKSCEHANKTNTPIVFDPVGAGVSNIRNTITKEMVEFYELTAIRGNMSEIKAIVNLIDLEIKDNEKKDSAGKGVDVAESDIITRDNLYTNGLIVRELAKELETVVMASGPIDIISDGEYTFALENGDAMMPLITGSGCMLSTIIGTYIGANEPLIGAITASALMAIAGENAAEAVKKDNLGPGSFRNFLIDNLYKVTADDISKRANLFEIDLN